MSLETIRSVIFNWKDVELCWKNPLSIITNPRQNIQLGPQNGTEKSVYEFSYKLFFFLFFLLLFFCLFVTSWFSFFFLSYSLNIILFVVFKLLRLRLNHGWAVVVVVSYYKYFSIYIRALLFIEKTNRGDLY